MGLFTSVLSFVCPTPWQIEAMMKAKDDIGRTILVIAASSGDRVTFDTVLAAVMEKLDSTEVRHPLFVSN